MGDCYCFSIHMDFHGMFLAYNYILYLNAEALIDNPQQHYKNQKEFSYEAAFVSPILYL